MARRRQRRHGVRMKTDTPAALLSLAVVVKPAKVRNPQDFCTTFDSQYYVSRVVNCVDCRCEIHYARLESQPPDKWRRCAACLLRHFGTRVLR